MLVSLLVPKLFFFTAALKLAAQLGTYHPVGKSLYFSNEGFFVLYFAFLFYSARVAIINAIAIGYTVGETKNKEQENETVVYTHLPLRQRLPFHSTSKRKVTKRNS